MSVPPAEVSERLLTAWRGEILAGAVYALIARRLEPREAEIMRKMADAEGAHRRRLEQRMTDLGMTIPNPDSVRVPLWLRLQARVAPIDRLLAAREAAEDEEVDDLYKRSTGDPVTDQLLREIRREERSHSMAVADMRAGGGRDAGDGALTAPPASPPPERGDGPVVAVPGAQARLDKILGREKWHRSGASWISGAIYGANDGLAAVFGIVAGVSGATNGSSAVLTAGLAGAIASALSMATGAFLAERSEAEVAGPTSIASARRSRSTPRRRRRSSRSSTSSRVSTRRPPTSWPSRCHATPTRCSRRSPRRSSASPAPATATRSRRRSRPASPPGWGRSSR